MNEDIKQKIDILYVAEVLVNTIYFVLIHFLLGISRNALNRSRFETVQLQLTNNKL